MREGSSGKRELSVQTVYLTEDLGPYLTTKKYHNTAEESAPDATEESAPGATEESAPGATEESAPGATEESAPGVGV